MRPRRFVHTLVAAALLGALAVALVAAPALAGVELQTESLLQGGDNPGAPGTAAGEGAKSLAGRVLVQGDRVRIEGLPGGRARGGIVMIFRPDRQVLWVLDESDRAYVEMSPATATAMGSALEAARAKIEEQLAKMKPEQRAMAEQSLKARGGPLAAAGAGAGGGAGPTPAPVKATATGKSDAVAGLSCREFDVRRGKDKVAEACVATWADAGLAKSDLDALRKLALFQNEMLSTAGFQGQGGATRHEPFAMMDQLAGVPVRIRTFRDGALVGETRIVKFGHRDLEASLFELPAGYKPRTLPPEMPR